jgi:hypothetical protein
MQKKWIIQEDGYFSSGRVELHSDLANHKTTPKGGGLYDYDPTANELTLYGASFDFGHAQEEDIISSFKNCQCSPTLFNTRVYLSRSICLADADGDKELIYEPD